MNKKKLLKKALKKFDEWPYPNKPAMIYCIEDITMYKKGDFSDFDDDSDFVLRKENWQFVCTREQFEAAKVKASTKKPKFERFYMRNSKEAQEYLFSLGYKWGSGGAAFKHPNAAYVFANTSGELTYGGVVVNGGGELRELPTKIVKPTVDWTMAPEGATHALTTGKDWGGDDDLVGEVEFARLNSGYYYCYHDNSWSSARFVIGDDDWVILEARPTKTTKPVKPIYTQAMIDAGEKPKVGMEVNVRLSLSSEELMKGEVVHIGQNFGVTNFVVQCQNWLSVFELKGIHPIDTRTDKEKTIDRIMKIMTDKVNYLHCAQDIYDEFIGDKDA